MRHLKDYWLSSMLADILDWIQIGFSYHDCVFQNKLCFCVPMLVKDYWLSVMFATFERLLIVINVGGYFRLNSDWIFLPSTMNHFKMDSKESIYLWFFYFLFFGRIIHKNGISKNMNYQAWHSLTRSFHFICWFLGDFQFFYYSTRIFFFTI